MTGLSERIANEHTLVHADNPFSAPTGCRCGDPWTTPEDRLHHLTDVTERAVRDAIAQQLEQAQSSVFYPTHSHPEAPNGAGFTAGVAEGIDFASRIVREGTTP